MRGAPKCSSRWLVRLVWDTFAFLGVFIVLAIVISSIWFDGEAGIVASGGMFVTPLLASWIKAEIYDWPREKTNDR
jgi:hypothetical protein